MAKKRKGAGDRPRSKKNALDVLESVSSDMLTGWQRDQERRSSQTNEATPAARPRSGGQRGWVRRLGRWWYWFYRGDADENGDRPEYSFKLDSIDSMSHAEARAAADDLAGALLPLKGTACSWPAWCRRFLEVYVPLMRRPGTRSVTASIVRTHLAPAFGKRRLNEIRKAHMQSWIASMSADAAPDSVRQRYSVLRKMLVRARSEGFTVEIPDSIDLPSSDHAESLSLKPYTNDELELVLGAAPEPLKTIVMLCALVNLRICETLGLKVEDVDVAARRLTIIRQATRGRVTKLKTEASRAEQHRMGPKLAAHLRAYLATHAREGFLFPSPRRPGKWLHETGVRKALNTLLAQLGLKIPGRAFHGARRWFGTEGARDGAPAAALQRAMRHGDRRSTERYIKLDTSDADDVIERVEARFFRGKQPKVVRLVRRNGKKDPQTE